MYDFDSNSKSARKDIPLAILTLLYEVQVNLLPDALSLPMLKKIARKGAFWHLVKSKSILHICREEWSILKPQILLQTDNIDGSG